MWPSSFYHGLLSWPFFLAMQGESDEVRAIVIWLRGLPRGELVPFLLRQFHALLHYPGKTRGANATPFGGDSSLNFQSGHSYTAGIDGKIGNLWIFEKISLFPATPSGRIAGLVGCLGTATEN
jgi:hypothetical protein